MKLVINTFFFETVSELDMPFLFDCLGCTIN